MNCLCADLGSSQSVALKCLSLKFWSWSTLRHRLLGFHAIMPCIVHKKTSMQFPIRLDQFISMLPKITSLIEKN